MLTTRILLLLLMVAIASICIGCNQSIAIECSAKQFIIGSELERIALAVGSSKNSCLVKGMDITVLLDRINLLQLGFAVKNQDAKVYTCILKKDNNLAIRGRGKTSDLVGYIRLRDLESNLKKISIADLAAEMDNKRIDISMNAISAEEVFVTSGIQTVYIIKDGKTIMVDSHKRVVASNPCSKMEINDGKEIRVYVIGNNIVKPL